MNVRLQWDSDFLAGVYFQDRLQFNSYSVSFHLQTRTNDAASINVAMDRLRYFLHGSLEHAVFMRCNDAETIERGEMLELLGVNVIPLPEEPVDQIIGMMLYYKINAVMEGRMVLTGIDINSSLGSEVWYCHDEEDDPGPFVTQGWWHSNASAPVMAVSDTPDSKTVKVTSTGWHDLDLDWPEQLMPVDQPNTVVYANFARNEDNKTR